MRNHFASLMTGCAIVTLWSLVCIAQATGQASSAATSPVPSREVQSGQQSAEVPHFTDRYPRYRISPSDAFDLIFEFSPEFNQSVIVQPDGFVTLKDIGDVHIAGETVPIVTARLQSAYGKILANPSISIVLKDFNHPYFTANGEVGKPGKYELRANTTVTEGVAIAGGFLPSSKHSQVLLFRHVDDEWVQARIINVKRMVKKRSLKEDMYLQPGDMLYVPKNAISKIDAFLPKAEMAAYGSPF